jgi:membrane protein YdbS with pleckstrin-like domain
VKKQKISFHAEHLEAQTGIFLRQHIHVRYDNVKKVESTQIPFTDQGRLTLYVAGERGVQQQKGHAGAGLKIPYSLHGNYIEGISLKVDAVDALMLGLIKPSQIEGEHAQDGDVLLVSQPSMANELVVLMLVGLFMPPLWLFTPILAWQIKVRRYRVESDRVVLRGGILFKSVTSVLFNRIDTLQQNQGALGKAFGNGQVTILTAGSSMPDLTVANIPDYQDVYSTIRKHYGKHNN